MIAVLRHMLRLYRIARVLARYDALEALEVFGVARGVVWLARPFRRRRQSGRLGQRLAKAAEELGPVFIKLGQALSTRADLIGAQAADDLAQLRDRLPAFPAAEARTAVAEALGAPVEQLYARFDDVPVAAASIAQVHFAETGDGRPVAVKVLRPGIQTAFERDLALLAWLAGWIERTRPRWRRLRPVDSVRTFADMVAVEMDLRLEGAAASELADNFADDPDYIVPAVDWARTSRSVLTTERVEGIAIDNRQALIAAGIDPDAVLTIAARVMFLQVFDHGFFHGDPHPGNLFVDPAGRVAVVDFGIMGRLDLASRRYLAEMLLAFLSADYERVAKVHFRAGLVPKDQSLGAFTLACRSIGEPILGKPASEISVGRLLGQLFQITETFGMQTQPHLLLLQKVLVVAEGVGRSLNPDANMWAMAAPLIRDWMATNMGPEARARDMVAAWWDTAQRVPGMIDRSEELLTHLEAGAAAYAARGRRSGRAAAWSLVVGGLALGLALAALVLG